MSIRNVAKDSINPSPAQVKGLPALLFAPFSALPFPLSIGAFYWSSNPRLSQHKVLDPAKKREERSLIVYHPKLRRIRMSTQVWKPS